MRHLGDITKINGSEVPVVDCIIGGSPCQDLSIAGKRAGLAGERSGLYMEQIRIIKEMREHDRRTGRTGEFVRPRYMVWENVPGAFSSNKGQDFGAVLEEAVKVAEPEAPPVPVPEKGWPTSGCLMGDGWSVAWRVFDAQFWGVPQRRRRIALVADFGGKSAPEILFVRKSLSGNTEESGEKGQGFTAGAETGVDGASYAVRIRGGCDGGGKGALVQTEVSGTLGCNNDQTIFQMGKPTVYGIGSYHSNAWKSDNPDSGVYIADTAKTLDAINCGYPACNQGGMAVVQPVAAGFMSKQGAKAGGIGYAEEQAPTLATNRHDEAVLIENHPADSRVKLSEDGVCQALTSRMGTGGGNVPLCMDVGFFQAAADVSPTLLARTYKDPHCVATNMRVRRLTPLECERLQGFPDGWTDIGSWVDGNGKHHKDSDSPRYKALGNSIALPNWKWILKRLCAQYERDATMASLFDGIGGFSWIWEQLNGKGTCLWASEIEEFPIAVTKTRIGG